MVAIKIHLLHLVVILFPHIIDDARSKPHQTKTNIPAKIISPYELEGMGSEWDQRLSYASGTEQGGCRIISIYIYIYIFTSYTTM